MKLIICTMLFIMLNNHVHINFSFRISNTKPSIGIISTRNNDGRINLSRIYATKSSDLRIRSIGNGFALAPSNGYTNLGILSPSHINYKSSSRGVTSNNNKSKANPNNNNNGNNHKPNDRFINQAIGALIVLSILAILGMKENNGIVFGMLTGDIIEVEEEIGKEVGIITKTVIETAVPLSGSEIVSLSVGEGISGIISALATSSITFFVNSFVTKQSKSTEEEIFTGNRNEDTYYNTFTTDQQDRSLQEKDEEDNAQSGSTGNALTNAVADGEYFLTRASFLTLFETIGIPYEIAVSLSVLWANIPYQFIRLVKARNMDNEDGDNQNNSKNAELNFVELFADITKWLEYDVLATKFGSKTYLSTISPGLESAGFGLFAGLSSQIYADLLYTYTTFGCSEEVRLQNLRRPFSQTIRLYFDKCLSNAILFGVYTSIRKPISQQINNLLTGGVDSCIGSANYDLCTEAFLTMNQNIPEASFEAQVRAFVIALVGLSDRFLDFDIYYYINLDNDNAAYFRGLLVTLYSVLRYYFSFLFEGELSIV